MGGGTGHTHLETVCPLDRTGSSGQPRIRAQEGRHTVSLKGGFPNACALGGGRLRPGAIKWHGRSVHEVAANCIEGLAAVVDGRVPPHAPVFPGRTCLGMHCTARGVSLFGRVKTTDILKSSPASHGKSRGAATQIPPSEISRTIPACTAPSGPLTSAGAEIVFRG